MRNYYSKISYEKDNCWAVLCEHDGKIPLLEWYPSSLAVEDHKPALVADLLDVAYVNPTIGDPRTITIGFNDPQRQPLEIVSLSLDECNIWIELMKQTLSSLNCLTHIKEDNIYVDLSKLEKNGANWMSEDVTSFTSITSNAMSTLHYQDNQQTSVPQILQQDLPIRPSTAPSTCSSSSPPQSTDSFIFTPTLPRSNLNSKSDLSSNLSTTKKFAGHTFGARSRNGPTNNAIPSLPPRQVDDSQLSSSSATSSPAKSLIKEKYYDILNISSPESSGSIGNNLYDKVKRRFPSSTTSNTSSDNETCSSLTESIQSMTLNSLMPLRATRVRNTNLKDIDTQTFYEHLPMVLTRSANKKDQNNIYDSLPIKSADMLNDHRERMLSLAYTVCAEHIIFVEISGRVFIGGWTSQMQPKLVGLIHVGDEIIECDGIGITNLEQFRNLLCMNDTSGCAISFKVKSIPFGKVFFLRKSLNTSSEELFSQILFRGKKNIEQRPQSGTYEEVDDENDGDCQTKSNHVYDTITVDITPVITELNDKPTNLFAANDQLYRRVDKLSKNAHFSIIVHPRDFSRLLKTNIKQSQHAIRYIHDQ
uniref:PH domain-containing protein n=1 Tax=Rhabditophanes sp. KR3021 TaxID=114890 RepID=A0AC35U4Z3_9BILA